MLRRLKRSELQQLADRIGIYRLSDEDLDEFHVLTESMFDTLDPLSAPAPTVPVTRARRDAGRVATRAEDPLNAVLRWCSVSSGADGPLAGKRIGLKDAIGIAGVPMTCGSRLLEGYVPQADSVLVERLLEAGAEIVAVLNMDSLGFSGGGDTSDYGPIMNPVDPERTAGGSSGGPAAALAYDGIDFTYGTDQGGSVRLPASWCGVLGIKPSFGLIPYTGIAGIDHTVDFAGPLARSVDDLALALDVVAGPHESDPRQRGIAQPPSFRDAVASAPADLAGMTFGMVREGFDEDRDVEPATAEAARAAVDRLRELGAEVREVSVPLHASGGAIGFASFVEGETANIAGFGNGYGWAGRFSPEFGVALGRGLATAGDSLPTQIKVALLVGTYMREHYFGSLYAKAQNLRPAMRADYDRALEEVDVLVMPTATKVAQPYRADASLSERVIEGWSMLGNTTPTNVTGHPSLSIPAAVADGLPVGLMLTGRMLADDRLLAVAKTYESAFGWQPETAPASRERGSGT